MRQHLGAEHGPTWGGGGGLRAKFIMCAFRVNHSKNAIVKPQGKTAEVAQKEVEEAMRKAREAQQAIAKTLEPGGSGYLHRLLTIIVCIRYTPPPPSSSQVTCQQKVCASTQNRMHS